MVANRDDFNAGSQDVFDEMIDLALFLDTRVIENLDLAKYGDNDALWAVQNIYAEDLYGHYVPRIQRAMNN